MTRLERLRMGRETIAAGRWCQGRLAGGGHRCLIGSLYTAEEVRQVLSSTFGDLREFTPYHEVMYLAALLSTDEVMTGWEINGVAGWNDDPGRTREEVVALLDRAILAEEWAQMQAEHAASPAENPVANAELVVA